MIKVVNVASLALDTIENSLRHIAENLREDDLAEIRASHGKDADPVQVVLLSFQLSSHVWFVLDRTGLPVTVFGVAPHMIEGVGIAWMLGTDGMLPEAFHIGRQTPRYLAEMQAAYPVLWANVDARNEVSMRWLEWSGFFIADADPLHGPEERLFIEFIRIKPDV